jgi:hypothetical protein
LLVALTTCRLDDPQALRADNVFTLSPDSTTLQADSLDQTRVVASLHGDTPTNASVTFSAGLGQFVGAPRGTPGSLTVEASAGAATAVYLSASRAGVATITASIGSVTQSVTITLTPSRPTSISLAAIPSRAKGDGTQAVTLTATLLRPDTAGVISRGTRVDFIALDSLGVEIPEMRGAVTFDGSSINILDHITSTFAGMVTVRASVGEGAVSSNPALVTFTP